MMAAVFTTLFVALLSGWLGRRAIAAACMLACFVLAIWLFLWEIYSPETGFRMPWLQTRLDLAPPGEA